MIKLLDVGGEGRFGQAVNLNIRSVKTLGPNKGAPIPSYLRGRADEIPLPDATVRVLVMERTPLSRASVIELRRVVIPGGFIILRHHASIINPHRVAGEIFGEPIATTLTKIGSQTVFQSVYRVRKANADRKSNQ